MVIQVGSHYEIFLFAFLLDQLANPLGAVQVFLQCRHHLVDDLALIR